LHKKNISGSIITHEGGIRQSGRGGGWGGGGLGRTAVVESANSPAFGECIIYTQVRPQSFSQHSYSEASKLFPKHNYITKGNRKYSSEINGGEDNLKKRSRKEKPQVEKYNAEDLQ
jgi:hypothetical protein